MVNLLGDVTNNSGATLTTSNEDGEKCCVGLIEIVGNVNIGYGSKKGYKKYSGAVTVTRVTKCLADIPCEGVSPFPNPTSCDEVVKAYNKPYKDTTTSPPNPSTVDYQDGTPNPSISKGNEFQGLFRWTLNRAVKLGCCTGSCPDKISVETHRFSGEVPYSDTAWFGTNVVAASDREHGTGKGTSKFKPCC